MACASSLRAKDGTERAAVSTPVIGEPMTADLLAMADWFAAQGVMHVVMENTGLRVPTNTDSLLGGD